MLELRLRSKIAAAELDAKKGKVLTDGDYNVLLTGRARVKKPDGSLLCIYLPGAVKEITDAAYPTLTTIRVKTENRGLASGTVRVPTKTDKETGRALRSRSMPVVSSTLGAMEATGNYRFCRLTAFTGQETEKWQDLLPYFKGISALFKEHVPERFANQAREARQTAPEWVIPGTPFTTITVNNSYSTGVHTDKGDLDEGFSCLSVARRGDYRGGVFTFPEYRLGVDLQDGDLILMDAHEWHGNTAMFCNHCNARLLDGPCYCQWNALDKESQRNATRFPSAERVSVVCYYRTRMKACGTAVEEQARREAQVA